MKNKAIFLDRDGTINVDKNYLYKIDDWEFENGAIESLRILQNLGFKLIVISNQSGIGRNYYTKEDADIIFKYMEDELKKENIKISKSYYCPHYNEECECRKPKLGLFYQAQKEFDIDFSRSYAIGDKLRDLAICNKEKTIGFLLSHNEKIDNSRIIRCENILQATKKIEEMEGKNNNE